MPSPYKGKKPGDWLAVTNQLVDKHPLDPNEITEVVLSAWESIFASKLGTKGFHIGKDIFPKPQIMGFFMHELIPLELAARYPKEWRGEESASDKDIVYIPDDGYSIEVKTSSNPNLYNDETIKRLGDFDLMVAFDNEEESRKEAEKISNTFYKQTGRNAVGVFGLNLYNDETIKRLNDFDLMVAFDNDERGRKEAEKISNTFYKQTGRIADREKLPDGIKDITELFIYKAKQNENLHKKW